MVPEAPLVAVCLEIGLGSKGNSLRLQLLCLSGVTAVLEVFFMFRRLNWRTFNWERLFFARTFMPNLTKLPRLQANVRVSEDISRSFSLRLLERMKFLARSLKFFFNFRSFSW